MQNKDLYRITGTTAAAVMLAMSPVHAQTTGTDTTPSGTAGTSAAAGGSAARDHSKAADTSGASNTSGASGSDKSTGKVSDEDKELMEDIAHANLAEIETGKMALEKSQDQEVRQFAQRMVDDHTKAMKELQKLAESKGVELPTETDIAHKTIATALQVLSGDTFDSQYISRVAVGDHQRTRDLLQKTQKEAEDEDLKAYADKTLKVINQHLDAGKKLENSKPK